ncbi:MAG TPA: hypothetical protein VFQ60_00255, partial [Patescibacteria group bacterium]|nr:hypothetical protein [Patescibacteria group bacterium]
MKENMPTQANPISSEDRWNRIRWGDGTPLPKVELPKGLFEDSQSFDYPELKKMASLAGKFLDEAHSEEDWSARLEAIVDRCAEHYDHEDLDQVLLKVLAEIMRQQKSNLPALVNPISSKDRWNRIMRGKGTPLPKVELPKGLFEDSRSFDYPELEKIASLAGKFLDEAHSEEDWSARLEAIVDRCGEYNEYEDFDPTMGRVLAEIM